eukprot:SAG31_NODE_29490_length_394_cov_1.050847_2_plen_52_part_01
MAVASVQRKVTVRGTGRAKVSGQTKALGVHRSPADDGALAGEWQTESFDRTA